jgi:hypothetical protein
LNHTAKLNIVQSLFNSNRPNHFLTSNMPEQEDGCYPRVNGGMIQSNQYNGTIVSVVGKVIGPATLQTADGTNISLQTEFVADGLLVNPDLCIEIIGQVNDATMVTVSTVEARSFRFPLPASSKRNTHSFRQ